MITKTLGTILILIVCILVFPVTIAILGGAFGIVAGVFGAVFGGVIGAIGAIFGAVFGLIGSLFHGLFNWHHGFNFFHCNMFTLLALTVIVALAIRSRDNNRKRNTKQ
jgi:hypothetical protein